MIEFLFIMFKSYLNFIIFLICKLFYINHNYKVIEILPPWTDGFVNNGRYYDFNIIYKCVLCGKTKKINYYMDLKEFGRGIEFSEVELLKCKIQKNNFGFFTIKKNNGFTEYCISSAFKRNGIYKIKNTSTELRDFINKHSYMKAKIYGEYLFIAVFLNEKERNE